MLVYRSTWDCILEWTRVLSLSHLKSSGDWGMPMKKVNVYCHVQKDEEETPRDQQDDPPISVQKKYYRASPRGRYFQAQEQQQGDWEQPTRICK